MNRDTHSQQASEYQMQTAATPVLAPAPDAPPPATALYEAANSARQELRGQLDALVSQRHGYLREIEDHGDVGGQAVTGMQQRIVQIDGRIAEVDNLIKAADAQVATAAAIPGAVTIQPPQEWNGPPREVFFFAPFVILALFLPVSIAVARGVWKRGTTKMAEFPREVMDRLSRLEQIGEATSLEIERIGEGQRFVTKLLTERPERIGAGIDDTRDR